MLKHVVQPGASANLMSEFDDLLGGGDSPSADEAPRARRGRPSNEEVARRMAEAERDAAFQREVRMAGQGKGQFKPEDFYGLCSQNQIARLMHMDPMTVKKRLERCPIAGTVGNNRPVYYFHQAIEYIVKPKMDLATYLKTLNPSDMPNAINKVFWEAERIKNKVLLETGEAWASADVLEVFGQVFMLFKDRIPIITEGMRDEGLSDEQYDSLVTYCDQLQADLHEKLVEMPAQRATPPRSASIDTTDKPKFMVSDGATPVVDFEL